MKQPGKHERDDVLARLGEDEISDLVMGRIADHIAAEGPRVVRRARQTRALVRVGAVALPVALAVIWISRTPEPARVPTMVASTASACEGWDSPPNPRVEPDRLELGRRGVAWLSPGAELTVERNERCQLVLRLERGEVLVHARDLGGGRLVVETLFGRVGVLGTIFQVQRRGDEFSVQVAEGVVEVEAAREKLRLPAGRRAELRAGGLRVEALAQEERARLLEKVLVTPSTEVGAQARRLEFEREPTDPPTNDEPRAERRPRPRPERSDGRREPSAEVPANPPAPPETAESLVAEAGRQREHAPDRARALYRRAGSMSGTIAEAAWLSLARLELSAQRLGAALAALDEREKRFPGGSLSLEAAGIRLEVLIGSGDEERAMRIAKEISARWPRSQQAKKAEAFLESRSR